MGQMARFGVPMVQKPAGPDQTSKNRKEDNPKREDHDDQEGRRRGQRVRGRTCEGSII